MLLGRLIYEMASWTRAIVIPLAVVHSFNPQRPVPAGFTLDELLAPGVPLSFANNEGFLGWRKFFLLPDKFVKFWERHGSRSPPPKTMPRAAAAGTDTHAQHHGT